MNNTTLLKKLLLPYNIGQNKIHIGPKYDGGYVLSKEILDNTDAVYSLGIGTECGFDYQLAELGYPIFMYESSHSTPPKQHENFHYKQLFINAEVLEKEIEFNGHKNKNLLLAMDIEGGEYQIFSTIPDSVLFNFKQIVFEVHDVLHNPNLAYILERLNHSYKLIHIHTNNNCIRSGAFSSGMSDGVPNVLELTYVHKSQYKAIPTIWDTCSPINDLDYKNQLDLDDVELNWWLNLHN